MEFAIGAQLPVKVPERAANPIDLLTRVRNALGGLLTGDDLYAWEIDTQNGAVYAVEREAMTRARHALD